MQKEKDERLDVTTAPDDESSAVKDNSGASSGEQDSGSGAGTFAPQETCGPGIEGEQPEQKRQIGRYELVCLLGEGGMGRVYKAYDPSLNRYVALKILHGDEPGLIERFLREARMQAQVQHEHACKIYEVGEADGKPFIAMQYIKGKTLRDATEEMTREQKVMAIKEAAEALHAAHKIGLIHRDIKPTNIMVERAEDGSFKPYIMDFGIAREQKTPGLTITGILIGTPAYMSPEQARGDIHNLDRRTDIYALGATLYELFSGKSPFDANTNAEMVVKVLQDEPIPLTKLNALVPEELQTIVMKCLEKEPERRYDTARALAEDLGRFLEGEPILAQSPSLIYKWQKKIKKNKALTIVGGCALLAILIITGLWLWSKHQANEQMKLASEFDQNVRYIEETLKHAYTAPLHDVRAEEQQARSQIKEIENKMQQIGKLADGPGHFAMGRACMMLKDLENARKHLQTAWDAKYQIPEVGYTLGKVLGMMYKQELQETERISSKEDREQRKDEIIKEFREPALKYLKQSKGVKVESMDFEEALVAYYEKDYMKAIEKAQSASRQISWLYEAKKLEGDIYSILMGQERDSGKFDLAVEYFRKAENSFESALAIGRSDASIYEGLCHLMDRMMYMKLYLIGGDVAPYFDKGIKACQQALIAHPESTTAFYRQSLLYSRKATYEQKHGIDPRNTLLQAIKEAKKALKITPDHIGALNAIGLAYKEQARYKLQYGGDPREDYKKSLEAHQKVLELNPNSISTYIYIGLAYTNQASHELLIGGDPRDYLNKAQAIFQKGLAIDPKSIHIHNNLANAFSYQALYEEEHGFNPENSYKKAISAYEKCLESNPKDSFCLGNLGETVRSKGYYEYKQGNNPQLDLEKAVQILSRASELNANASSPLFFISHAYAIMARFDVEKDTNPKTNLERGINYLNRGLAINSQDSYAYEVKAMLSITEGLWLMKQARDPLPKFNQAHKDLDEALKLNQNSANALFQNAESYRWLAEWKSSRKQSPDEDIEQGISMLKRALSINKEMAEAKALQGVFYLMKADIIKSTSEKKAFLEQAQTLFDDAFSMNRNLMPRYNEFSATTQTQLSSL